MLDEAGGENRKRRIDVCYRRKRSSKPSQSTTGSTSLSFTTPSQSTTGSTSLSFTTPSQSTTGSTSLSFTTPSQSTTGSTSLSFTTLSQSTIGSTSLSFTTWAPSVAAYSSSGNLYQGMHMHSPVPPPLVSTPVLYSCSHTTSSTTSATNASISCQCSHASNLPIFLCSIVLDRTKSFSWEFKRMRGPVLSDLCQRQHFKMYWLQDA